MKKLLTCLALVALLACSVCAYAVTMNGEVMYAAQGVVMLESDYTSGNSVWYSCAIINVGDSSKTYFAISRETLDDIFVSHEKTPLIAVSWLELDRDVPRTFQITDVIQDVNNPIAILVSEDSISGTVKADVSGDLASGDEFYFCNKNTPDYTYLTGKVGSKQTDRDDGCRYAITGDFASNGFPYAAFNAEGEFVGITDGADKIYTAKSVDALVGTPVTKWLIIAAGVLAAAVIALVVVRIVRKPKPAYIPPVMPEPASPEHGSAKAYCETGAMAGNEYMIGSGLTIGRDPSRCDVVYPQDAPGISAVHCRLTPMTDGSVMLTDMGSSYGTFVGVEKLAPHVGRVMYSGESFALGDARNTYTIRI